MPSSPKGLLGAAKATKIQKDTRTSKKAIGMSKAAKKNQDKKTEEQRNSKNNIRRDKEQKGNKLGAADPTHDKTKI